MDLIERAVREGIITAEQAGAMRALAERTPGTDDGSLPVHRPAGISLTTELLAYLGGVLVLAGAGTSLAGRWDDLADGTRIVVLAVGALTTLAGGAILRRQDEPATGRLVAVLWFLSAAAVFGSVAYLLDTTMELSGEGRALLSGVATSAYAGALYGLHRRTLQQAALFGAVLTAGLSAAALSNAESDLSGLVLLGVGGAWLAAGLRGVLAPLHTAAVLGSITASIGPAYIAVDFFEGSNAIGLGIGIATGAVLVLIGIVSRAPGPLAVGVLAMFGYLTGLLAEVGGGLAVPVVVAGGGVALIVAAAASARILRRRARVEDDVGTPR